MYIIFILFCPSSNPTPVIGFIWVHIRTFNQTFSWVIFDHLKDFTPAFFKFITSFAPFAVTKARLLRYFRRPRFQTPRTTNRRSIVPPKVRTTRESKRCPIRIRFERIFFTGKLLNFRPQVVPQVVAGSKSETTESLSVETAN